MRNANIDCANFVIEQLSYGRGICKHQILITFCSASRLYTFTILASNCAFKKGISVIPKRFTYNYAFRTQTALHARTQRPWRQHSFSIEVKTQESKCRVQQQAKIEISRCPVNETHPTVLSYSTNNIGQGKYFKCYSSY